MQKGVFFVIFLVWVVLFFVLCVSVLEFGTK